MISWKRMGWGYVLFKLIYLFHSIPIFSARFIFHLLLLLLFIMDTTYTNSFRDVLSLYNPWCVSWHFHGFSLYCSQVLLFQYLMSCISVNIWLNMQCWIAHFLLFCLRERKMAAGHLNNIWNFVCKSFQPCFNSVYLKGFAVIYLDLQEADILSLIPGTVS